MSWLSPSKWLLYGGLLLGVALGLWRLDASRQQLGYDRAQAEYTAAALQASEAARVKEQDLQTKVAKVNHDYQTEKKRRVADAAVAAGRLRDLESALSAAASADTAPLGGSDDPRGAIIHQCAWALVGMDEYAKSMAAKARALQAYAGTVCVTP